MIIRSLAEILIDNAFKRKFKGVVYLKASMYKGQFSG